MVNTTYDPMVHKLDESIVDTSNKSLVKLLELSIVHK